MEELLLLLMIMLQVSVHSFDSSYNVPGKEFHVGLFQVNSISEQCSFPSFWQIID